MFDRRKILCVVLLVSFFVRGAASEKKVEDPFKVKSGYIISYIKYLEWTQKDVLRDDDSPIVIGILSEDSEASEEYKDYLLKSSNYLNNRPDLLKQITKNHRLDIKQFTSLDEVTPCHILFILSSEMLIDPDSSNRENNRSDDKLLPLKKQLNDFPSLLIADFDGFADDMGGHINFTQVEGHIEFIINLAALKKTGIQVRVSLIDSAYKKITKD